MPLINHCCASILNRAVVIGWRDAQATYTLCKKLADYTQPKSKDKGTKDVMIAYPFIDTRHE